MADRVTEKLLRHIDAAHNAALPGDRRPFRIGGHAVGWLKPDFAEALAETAGLGRDRDGGVTLPAERAAELPGIAQALSEATWFRWRAEEFDVRESEAGPALTRIDRGAVPSFGIVSHGVHCNGLVRKTTGLHLWVARRAADKLLDPGKLDHIVAGGVSAGMGTEETLIKEAQEEAAIAPALAASARHVCRIRYDMERAEGLRRDLLYCYDLDLPEDFAPSPSDGEVAGFELWPIEQAFETVLETEAFKFNVNLVLIDLFLREGLVRDATSASALRYALTKT
jgi:8-oxo-dGTP pyrophosphatase MutT (NUDIX family)